ncbi:MAG: glutamate racemase [Bdellovibrionota bacterium]
MAANQLKIGIFDSGVGGLTIMQAVEKHIPNANYIYCSDSKNYPYGPKRPEEVKQFSVSAATKLFENEALDTLIVACNTASTIALDEIRSAIPIPVIGVVPAIKPAAALSTTKVIGLLATPGTVTRKYTDNLINEFASQCQVIKVGSSKLVQIAENQIKGQKIDLLEIRAELGEILLMNGSLDTVVLACTHFPC